MKQAFLTTLMFFASLTAMAEYQLLLPVTGGQESPVFFIDFSQFKIQTDSLKLKTAAGKEIPFSLDCQYAPQKEKGRFYYTQVNGYHSHLEVPASEKKLSWLGYLSFKAEPGVKEYRLSFKAGTEAIQAAPNPDVRCWWIELMQDPELRKPFGGPDFFYRNSAQAEVMENGGWELFRPGGTITIMPNAYRFTERIRGRRVIQYFLAEMDGNTSIVAQVPLTNASNPKWPVVTGYMSLRKGVLTEVWQEGIQDSQTESIWFNAGKNCRGSFWVVQKVTGKIFEIHVQSPPQEEVVQARVLNSLLNIGDTLKVDVLELGQNVLQPMRFKLIDPAGRSQDVIGAREDCWADGAELHIVLKDRAGRTVAATVGKELLIDNIPAGEYTVALTLYSCRQDREIILQQKETLLIQAGPQW